MTRPKPTLAWLLPILATALALAVFLVEPLPLRVLRNTVFDQYQRWSPRVYQPVPVRIVDIDDASLARLGQWPWPRGHLAELTEHLRAAGAAAIAFDVIFAEPDRTAPAAMLRSWRSDDPALRAALGRLPDPDQLFAASIAPGGVVLGHALTRAGATPGDLHRPYRTVDLGPSPRPYLHAFNGAIGALPDLQRAAAGNGAITFVPDSDGVVRRVPMLLRLGEEPVPSLVAEALRVGQGATNYLIKTVPEAGVGLESVRIGAATVPTTAEGEVWVRYTRPVAARYIPAWQVLDGSAPVEALRGHIVLVGSSSQGLLDLRFSPLGRMMPGVEAHAQALEQILAGESLTRPNWAPALEALGIVVGGLLVGVVGVATGALLSAGAVVGTLALTGWGGWLAYTQYGLLLDPLTPGLALLIVFIFASLWHHVAAERRQRWVRQAFARYVSPNLVSHLVDNPGHLELGGQRRECSFIFTDLAGFTSLMEMLDPVEAVALLNDYLDNMIRIAFAHEGTLDRIVGDAVAIMFSAPVPQADHRLRALRCARAMHHFARAYAAEANARGVAFGATRIGIHTGEVTVGNFGGPTIFDYRALGDPVNSAARLESVNKQLGTLVCVSEATLVGGAEVPIRPVGRLVLKGKSEALMVHEPLFAEGASEDTEYAVAYAALAAGKPDARALFERLAETRPGDGLVAFQLDRARRGELGERIVFDTK